MSYWKPAVGLLLAWLTVAASGCVGGMAPMQDPPWQGEHAVSTPRAVEPTATEPSSLPARATVRGQGASVAGAQAVPPAGIGSRSTAYPPTVLPPPSGIAPPPGGNQVIPPPPTPSAPQMPAGAGANSGTGQWVTSPYLSNPPPAWDVAPEQVQGTPVPLDVMIEEARTGRFMFGAGVNSSAGVTGQIIVDERNFDIFGFPRSLSEIWNGEAFRGGGQGFRLEAVPGNRVQRYLVSFTEPYLLSTPVSLNLSGSYYDRRFYDWDENRVSGRLGLGYRLTPDLSVTGAVRAERVKITDPRVLGVPELNEVLGTNNIYSGKLSLRHDTRDLPFVPTEGHLIEMSFEQAFGDFDFPRAEFDYRRYFLIRERPDGSGRHTLSFSLGAGFSGSRTPIFENYFAGGFTTLRGFDFRGASPVDQGVTVGGEFRMLGSVQYMMPLTADDMIKAVAFCDFGTVEREIEMHKENFRIVPGFGFRISIPAMGPAPLAFDFGFPVAKADTDRTEVFTFFFGFGRG